jgi:D-lactate dehydrogenase
LILEEKRMLDSNDSEKMRLLEKNRNLLNRDNVIYTPHMAFYSKEAVTRILDTTVENIQKFLAGHPENMVNR